MSDMMNRAQLKIGGELYGGWKSLRIERGIEQVSGSFNLNITERWPAQAERRPIKQGQPCQVLLDGEPVITGYVDDTHPSYSKDQHGITVSGRDKTGDLVDCSAIHKNGQWQRAKLSKIANDLCAPFGIKVIVDTDVGAAIPSFKIQEGESVFECLERAARMKAVLLISNGLGDLVITRASQNKISTALIEGINILSASGDFSWKDRHSKYIVKAQSVPNDNDFNPQNNTSPSATILDPVINRYRPTIIIADDQGTGTTLKQRAEWERNVRIGRGNRGTIEVQGWRHEEGLWAPNFLVPVRSPYLDVDAELLITNVAYTLDDGGSRCELKVCNPSAFALLAGVKGSKLSSSVAGKNGAASGKTAGAGKPKQDWSAL